MAPQQTWNHWIKTVLPLTALTVACALPLVLIEPLLGVVPIYISALTALAVARTTRVARDSSREKQELRSAVAHHQHAAADAEQAKALAEAAHTRYLADHELLRGTFAEIDRRAEADRAATIARLEQEYANTRARELAEYYAQGVADGEAGIWRLPKGNLTRLDDHRRATPPPPTGSAQS